eukprot:14088599-Alexandrium_andersonii.AAC.1
MVRPRESKPSGVPGKGEGTRGEEGNYVQYARCLLGSLWACEAALSETANTRNTVLPQQPVVLINIVILP